MYIHIANRRNEVAHKIRVLMALASCFDIDAPERKYLCARIIKLEVKLHDSTYTL